MISAYDPRENGFIKNKKESDFIKKKEDLKKLFIFKAGNPENCRIRESCLIPSTSSSNSLFPTSTNNEY